MRLTKLVVSAVVIGLTMSFIAAFAFGAEAAYLPSGEFIAGMQAMLEKEGREEGRVGPTDPKSYLYVQAGETYHNQPVAYFVATSEKEVFWQLEEFETLPNGHVRITTWKFTPTKAARWHAIVEQDGPVARYVSGGVWQTREELPITSPEVIAKSEFTQRLLRFAGKRTEM